MLHPSQHVQAVTIVLMLIVTCDGDSSTQPDDRLLEEIEYFATRSCIPYVSAHCDKESTVYNHEACATASRSFYSANRAGLYAVGSSGGWKQVTDYSGTLMMHTLSDLGTDYFNPSFTKLLVYVHGREMELQKAAAHNRFMNDGFCRTLGTESFAVDYAKLFREQGFNVFVWYWAQYSWSPAGALREHYDDYGTEVSPKIWADDYIRRNGKGFRGRPSGNPLWAKFSDASLCLGKKAWECKEEHDDVFEWTKTKTDKNDFDPSLAIGNAFAESLFAIAPKLSNVATFHLVGNSYGSQIALHGTYLVLQHGVQPCLKKTSLTSVPVPTRLVLIDPAYKQGAVKCGWSAAFCWNDPIFALAANQLKAIHDYGVPTLKIDATALANAMVGTIDTSPLSYNAATVHIQMYDNDFLGRNVDMHTQSVDWYFRTYFDHFSGAALASSSSSSCDFLVGKEPILFGCTADSRALASFNNLVGARGSELAVMELRQSGVNAYPWKAEWRKHSFCSVSWWRGCDQDKRGKPCGL
mmetsp:Transcript_161474/g.297775  ORF Transcript_161474/g.297775 Transcript_161474/m.297775 type:complete len:524 (+) Transcript_161474:71-1642(+)